MAGPKKPFQPDDVLLRARRRLGLEILPGHSDRAGLLELAHLLYPQLDISLPAYAAWQYDKNPAGAALERIGRVQGKVVGQYTVIPMRLQVNGLPVKGSLSANTMTHPDYRAKGIFMLLAEEVFNACREEGIALTYGFPNPNSHKGFLKHLNFSEAGTLPLWILPLDLRRMADSEKAGGIPGGALALRLSAPLWRVLFPLWSRTGRQQTAIRSVAAFDTTFDQFWKKVQGGYPNIVIRDTTYLNWRFSQHPTRRYESFAAYHGNEIQGYVVTRESAVAGISCGMLVDLLVANTQEGEHTAKDLVRHATQRFHEQGLALAGCLAPEGSVAARALHASGYIRCPERFLPQPFPVILRWHRNDPAPASVAQFKSWYFTMGDYDAV